MMLDLGIASAGGLSRDRNGAWIARFLLKIGRPELWGSRQGLMLMLAKFKGLQNLIIDVDVCVLHLGVSIWSNPPKIFELTSFIL